MFKKKTLQEKYEGPICDNRESNKKYMLINRIKLYMHNKNE